MNGTCVWKYASDFYIDIASGTSHKYGAGRFKEILEILEAFPRVAEKADAVFHLETGQFSFGRTRDEHDDSTLSMAVWCAAKLHSEGKLAEFVEMIFKRP